MEFTWDDRKNRANQQKHGISFETAILVFDDPLNVSAQDREVDGEPRWQTIGMVNGIHVLLVAHTLEGLDHDDGRGVIRILSARKATRQERRIYAQGI
ncbi:MAG TPA: BrnT family toxin [Candidatus Binatus sp.]|nr:BrnT family toxin [Candidatus Binatus sp.]